jgi:hypothetical protein
MKDAQVLKKELLELDVELRRLKRELLTARVNELERIVHAPTRRRSPNMPEIRMSMAPDVN